ncbi:lysoplasmalogenase family protein [Planktotalea sp.]|uniref:lysoplasmalogenase family protein n=1 Tax=Planktotalea sp. TaxID=2029877 RepID=UPI003D6A927A
MIWIVIGGLAAVLYGAKLTHEPVSTLRSLTKISASFALVLSAVSLGAPWLIIVGLVFGVIGDGFLSRNASVGFLPGLAAFLFGHLVYLYWAVFVLMELPAVNVHWLMFIGISALTLVSLLLLKRWWSKLDGLHLPVSLYVVISISLGGAALVLAGQGLEQTFSLGVAVFVLSDIILAESLFMMTPGSPKYRLSASTLWALYWLGQLGILLGSIGLAN